MEDAAFHARIQRLDRDIAYFQHLLQQAHRAETAEIRRQLLVTLQEKKAILQRQKEQVTTHIGQKSLENERMARAVQAIERMRNEQNWTSPKTKDRKKRLKKLTRNWQKDFYSFLT